MWVHGQRPVQPGRAGVLPIPGDLVRDCLQRPARSSRSASGALDRASSRASTFFSARFGQVRPTAAAAADDGRQFLHELARVHSGLHGGARGHQERGLPFLGRAEHHDRRGRFLAQAVRQVATLAAPEAIRAPGDHGDAFHLDRLDRRAALAPGQLQTELIVLLLQQLQGFEALVHALEDSRRRDAESLPESVQEFEARPRLAHRRGAANRLDAAHAGGHPPLARQQEGADLAGPVHVSAAAQLHAHAAGPHHPHDVAVAIAEERDRAFREGGLEGQFAG